MSEITTVQQLGAVFVELARILRLKRAISKGNKRVARELKRRDRLVARGTRPRRVRRQAQRVIMAGLEVERRRDALWPSSES